MTEPKTDYTVRSLAQAKVIGQSKVLELIRSGALRATDYRSPGTKTPRWRISHEQLAAFELERSNKLPSPSVTTSRRRKPTTTNRQFIK